MEQVQKIYDAAMALEKVEILPRYREVILKKLIERVIRDNPDNVEQDHVIGARFHLKQIMRYPDYTG